MSAVAGADADVAVTGDDWYPDETWRGATVPPDTVTRARTRPSDRHTVALMSQGLALDQDADRPLGVDAAASQLAPARRAPRPVVELAAGTTPSR
ncbi:hypothetical protein [Streptomyces naganishii]|uniref:Uncharacterized protein n=1 Tax=Streptomyces naganishii JCM 4654 TaxID=1306179 RepID=A0A918Y8L4_9ACTN|nr:hypothetical protein [Streptomyces naganishii]GHD94379.1 hypothetical protein GCM10010508_54930 [Streptomyces naganishii JCM 4654]